MLRTYTFVEGASLVGLILEVRREFWARLPYELDDFRQPNSIRHVAIDVFEAKPADERLDVLRDFILANGGLTLTGSPSDIFGLADTPGDVLVDLVSAVVQAVLERDPDLAAESQRRTAVARESLAALQDEWRAID